jgi:hypothetical protein
VCTHPREAIGRRHQLERSRGEPHLGVILGFDVHDGQEFLEFGKRELARSVFGWAWWARSISLLGPLGLVRKPRCTIVGGLKDGLGPLEEELQLKEFLVPEVDREQDERKRQRASN